MAAISDTHHVSPECDLRTGCEAFCQRNVHKPRLIPLSVAAVVQIHALWCALSLPPRLRRCCHQSRPTAQLAADRAVEEPGGHPGSAHPQRISPCATGHGSVAATRPWAGASAGFDPDSIPKKEPEQPPRVTHRTYLQARIEQEVLDLRSKWFASGSLLMAFSMAGAQTLFAEIRAFLLMVYSIDGDGPRTCNGATLFG
jgi:hypothetical protein